MPAGGYVSAGPISVHRPRLLRCLPNLVEGQESRVLLPCNCLGGLTLRAMAQGLEGSHEGSMPGHLPPVRIGEDSYVAACLGRSPVLCGPLGPDRPTQGPHLISVSHRPVEPNRGPVPRMNLEADPVIPAPSEPAFYLLEEKAPDPLSSEPRDHIELVDDTWSSPPGHYQSFRRRKRCRQGHDETGASFPSGLREQEEPPALPYLSEEGSSVGDTKGRGRTGTQVTVDPRRLACVAQAESS